MNRQKLATIVCIILSITFSMLLGFLIHFKAFLPLTSYAYERILYYPKTLYEEYQKEAERMIDMNEYTSQYPTKTTFYLENDRTTLVIEIGEYGGIPYDYITATVKNFGTNEQEITFERNRKSSEEAFEQAERYKTVMNILTLVFIIILIIFTEYLIKNSIKRRYSRVIGLMISIVFVIAIWPAVIYFFMDM